MKKDEIERCSPPSNDNPKEQRGVYLGPGTTPDDHVYRYINFDSLLQLLSGRFYVSAKQGFKQSDPIDAVKKPSPLMFRFTVVSDTPAPPMTEEEKERDKRYWANMRLSKGFLASCWTVSCESHLMWNAYTSGSCGVYIKSCVHDVVASIKSLKGYKAYCEKMSYKGYYYCMPFADYLFSKSKNYEDEKEVRFYFLPKRIEEYEKIPTDEDLAESAACTGKCFSIDPAVMISEITLSPFMRDNDYIEMKDLLERMYPFLKGRIRKSSFTIN